MNGHVSEAGLVKTTFPAKSDVISGLNMRTADQLYARALLLFTFMGSHSFYVVWKDNIGQKCSSVKIKLNRIF